MKSIAIVAFGHSASTIPFIKRLLDKGFKIDYYLLCSSNLFIEGIDYSDTKLKYGIQKVEYKVCPSLYNYMGDNFNFYTIRVLILPNRSLPIFTDLSNYVRRIHLNIYVKKILSGKYDNIHLVGRYNSNEISLFLKKSITNISVDLHEVCPHYEKDFSHPNSLLKRISLYDIPIVVHSSNSYNDLMQYGIFKRENIRCIHFGLFESYQTIKRKTALNLPKDYILCYGYIDEYKGLDILYKAVRLINKHLNKVNVKVVVAGYGNVQILKDIKKDKTFVCINKFLSNAELVQLIRNAKYIVCPYKSISQSGIPQTVFTFNKPIIASRLNSFEDVIKNNENGFLFPVSDEVALSSTMLNLLNDEVYSRIKNNVPTIWGENKSYDWDYITQQYIDFFNFFKI